MLIIKGTTFLTVVDAAKAFGVSPKTVRSYISRGILPQPPEIQYGLRILKHFLRDYMEEAKKLLDNYRHKKRALKKDKQLLMF